MVCAHCHKPMDAGARFCIYCGALGLENSDSHVPVSVSAENAASLRGTFPSPPRPNPEQRQVWQPPGADRGDPYAVRPKVAVPRASDAVYIPHEPVPVIPSQAVSVPSATEPVPSPTDTPSFLSTARLTGIFLLLCIPVVNLILACVWAFRRKESDRQLRSLGRAALLVITIVWVLAMAFAWVLIIWRWPMLQALMGILQ